MLALWVLIENEEIWRYSNVCASWHWSWWVYYYFLFARKAGGKWMHHCHLHLPVFARERVQGLQWYPAAIWESWRFCRCLQSWLWMMHFLHSMDKIVEGFECRLYMCVPVFINIWAFFPKWLECFWNVNSTQITLNCSLSRRFDVFIIINWKIIRSTYPLHIISGLLLTANSLAFCPV